MSNQKREQDAKIEVGVRLIRFARYAKVEFDDDDVDDYMMALGELGWEKALDGIKLLYRDRSVGKFPNVNQIREAALGISGSTDQADRQDRVMAISKMFELICSPMKAPSSPGALETILGPLAFQVVQMNGGWNSLKDRITNQNMSYIKKDLIDQAEAIQNRARRGLLDMPVGLPSAPAVRQPLRAISGSDMAAQFAHLMPAKALIDKP